METLIVEIIGQFVFSIVSILASLERGLIQFAELFRTSTREKKSNAGASLKSNIKDFQPWIIKINNLLISLLTILFYE
jgi:hypothetical protein